MKVSRFFLILIFMFAGFANLSGKPSHRIHVTKISNQTNEDVQVLVGEHPTNAKEVSRVASESTSEADIPITLIDLSLTEGLVIEDELFTNQANRIFFKFGQNGTIHSLNVKLMKGDGTWLINTWFRKEKTMANEAEQFKFIPIEEGTKEVKIGMQIVLSGDSQANIAGSKIEIDPILQSQR